MNFVGPQEIDFKPMTNTPELDQLEEILDVLDRQIIGLPKHIQEKMVALERDVQDYREDVLSRARDYEDDIRERGLAAL